MAAHYGTAILPARPRKPRDKAKVEQAVLIVERWLLGRLRRRPSAASPKSTPRSASSWRNSMKAQSFAGSASPAASCSRRSIARGTVLNFVCGLGTMGREERSHGPTQGTQDPGCYS